MGDQPMLSLIVRFWRKPYVCVQQFWDPVTRIWCVSTALGVMHPRFAWNWRDCLILLKVHYSYFCRVVTGSSIRTIRSWVTIMSCVWLVYLPCLTTILALLPDTLERACVSEGVQCISASPLLNYHWSLSAGEGLLEAKGRVSYQQLSADWVISQVLIKISHDTRIVRRPIRINPLVHRHIRQTFGLKN